MSLPRKNYSKEEKLEIVKRSLEDDQTVESLAVEFRVSVNSIYNWRKKYLKLEDRTVIGRKSKSLTAEQQEISSLKKQLRERDLELEILKKAVSIFSASDRKSSFL